MAFDPTAAYSLFATAGGWDSGDSMLYYQGGSYYRRFSPYAQVTPDTSAPPTTQLSYDPATGDILAGGVAIDVGGGVDAREAATAARWMTMGKYESTPKQAPSFLDSMSASALGAWGFTRMTSNYVGNCCSVRRASDDATLVIPFTANGVVDIELLTAFQGSSSLYLVTFYDQIGANDATQADTSKQPKLLLECPANGCPSFHPTVLTGYGYLDIPAGHSITSRADCSVWQVNAAISHHYTSYLWNLGASLDDYSVQVVTGSATIGPQAKIATVATTIGTPLKSPPDIPAVVGINSAAGGADWYVGTTKTTHAAFSSGGLAGGSWPTSLAYGTELESYAMVTFNAALSANDITLIQGGLAASYSTSNAYEGYIVLQGDSITAGSGLDGINYKRYLKDCLPGNIAIYSQGLSGQYISSMVTEAATYVDPYYVSGRTNIAIMLGGVNDIMLDSKTGEQVFASVQTWAAARKAVGFKVIVATLFTRGIGGSWNTTMIGYANDFNELLRASVGTTIDAIIDFDTDPSFVPLSTIDAPDELHLDPDGYTKAMAIFLPAIASQMSLV